MIATSAAMARATAAAIMAFTRSPPSSTKSASKGSAATSADANRESPTGSKTCLYISSCALLPNTEQRQDRFRGDLRVTARGTARDLDADDPLGRLADLVEHALQARGAEAAGRRELGGPVLQH